MKMSLRVVSFCVIISLAAFSGCAVIQKLGRLGTAGEPVNYALESNGAVAFASDYTSGHEPLTTINGVTSSEGWDDGEGWECRFNRERLRREGWSRLDPTSVMELGSAWLEVQFDGVRSINRVTIYTLDSEKYPAAQHGIQDAWLQLGKEHGWITVGEVENGAVTSRVNLDRRPAGGKMVFKFDHTETDKIRFVVFRSNDTKTIGQGWRNDRKSEKSVARVVEIEATGLGNISDKESIRVKRVKEAPNFSLQDLNGKWVRLSNFRGKVVIVTFWAAWSPESKQQVRDLNGLHDKYKDQNVVVIGISVDEGGAQRIKSFVKKSGLEYIILLVDTSTKSAYGGIGNLPSTFVIDQQGNIYREYFQYRRKNILELDIKKLLPSGGQGKQ